MTELATSQWPSLECALSPPSNPLFQAGGGQGRGHLVFSLSWEVEQVGSMEALLETAGSLLP